MNEIEKAKWKVNMIYGCPMSMYIVLDLSKRKVTFKDRKFFLEFPVLRCEGHYLNGPHFYADMPEKPLFVKVTANKWQPPKNNITIRMRGEAPEGLNVNELGACLGDEPFSVTLPMPALKVIYKTLFKLSCEGRYNNDSKN